MPDILILYIAGDFDSYIYEGILYKYCTYYEEI